MSKYVVKVGVDFDPKNEIKVDVQEVTVTIEVSESAEDKKKEEVKSSFFKDWKSVAVAAVVAMVFSTAAYASISGDYVLFDKVMAAMVKVANHSLGKK